MPDLMTPDPREARLPTWVREKLEAQRRTIANLQQVAASVEGDHPDSNVYMIERMGLGRVPLPKNSMVKFDNKWGGILVHHVRGKDRICIQGDNTLILRMEAGNTLNVELEDK